MHEKCVCARAAEQAEWLGGAWGPPVTIAASTRLITAPPSGPAIDPTQNQTPISKAAPSKKNPSRIAHPPLPAAASFLPAPIPAAAIIDPPRPVCSPPFSPFDPPPSFAAPNTLRFPPRRRERGARVLGSVCFSGRVGVDTEAAAADSDSPRAESPEESQAAAAAEAESPRAGVKRERDLRDIPASPSSPLPAAKRRYGLGFICHLLVRGEGFFLHLYARDSPLPPSVEKRVVSVPLAECGDRPRGASGEGPPPSDSWTWRKYGQKPIKGSPYPRRGYYRCSSSKGCPARKQVERSRADPTVLLVTYTFEHNHASPQPKSSSCQQQGKSSPRPPAPKPEPVVEQAELGPEHELAEPEAPEPEQEPEQEQEQKVVVSLVGPETATTATVAPVAEEDESFDFGWFDQYPTWHRSSLYAPLLPPEEWERELQGEDALFAGLGELPECAFVFGRRRELSLAATAPCS
ncbi:hypothetical protein HU200_037342 [Digitaria exilis]|uniref:WRKY domain-containing protein n=1 Tax=Digitaria exilis TaxID=1010633 RepID=A0A835ENE0_9POAL|nr:hypothetical protein HU200_037342 [Digitaria exilis]